MKSINYVPLINILKFTSNLKLIFYIRNNIINIKYFILLYF
jgi:hypothetical protein